ncbi:hypothetical protein AAFC00_005665 [Neodothiora populina]|uniref:Major facilitator superfamily (MFS) profile domain-containing protein n=1 Tax=Neodothiora populina TaxID=2781224 RepID=A0ABR3P5G0_9PEZI
MGLVPQLQGRSLTIGTTLACGLGFMLFGYDQGVFGGLLSNPSLLARFNNPNATIQGQIVSVYTLGCIVGAVLALFIGDKLGRRRCIALASVFLTVGGLLQATAYSLPHMMVGRIVSGFGIGMNTTTIPMWQSETCKPRLRGILVATQLTLLVFGFVLTNWMNFGFTYVTHNEVSWRFPLGFQCVLAIGTASILPLTVESPRWLCLVNRNEEARQALARLFAKPADHPAVVEALQVIKDTIDHEKATGEIGWREVFSNKEQQTFRRICLGAGANFMQQMGGVNVVAYYLPVVLERSFGFSTRMSLILSAVDSMQWMFWAAMATFVIERVGRKKLMLFGAAGQSLCFTVAAIGLGVGGKAANGVAVAFIFIYYFFFGLSFLAIPFMYPSEINSNRSRNIGSAIAMITNWVFVYTVVSITPPGIKSLGYKFYIIFAVLNLAWLPFIWIFYVETAGLSLDEIDRVFETKHAAGSNMSYDEAIRQVKDERVIHRTTDEVLEKGKGEDSAMDHVERLI